MGSAVGASVARERSEGVAEGWSSAREGRWVRAVGPRGRTAGVTGAFQGKRCQPFTYDSSGTLERGTQLYFRR